MQGSKSGSPAWSGNPSRREFLRTSGCAGFLCGLGPLGWLGQTAAAQAVLDPQRVRLNADIEPIVRAIEDTPREKAVAMAVGRLRSGLTYQHFMAALYLAGIRGVDSWNSGGTFHCVYVINAAHVLAREAPADERLLPLLWALDVFKVAQERQPRQMRVLVRETPEGAAAIQAARAAVQAWDSEAAERALAGMARSCNASDAFEELWRLGARDFRPIGHKAIFVANTWRTLETIGWQHAEPAFRALGRSLAGYGPSTVNNGFGFDDQCCRMNEKLVAEHASALPPEWMSGKDEEGATAGMAAELLAPIRAAREKAACRQALDLLRESKARAVAIWDVMHLAAAEFMLQQRGILTVHAATSLNALHFGFRRARSTETRLFLLLQAVGWMAHFARQMDETARAKGPGILGLGAAEIPDSAQAAAEQIYAQVGQSAEATARSALAYARRYPDDPVLFAAARRLVITRARDSHEYKYPAAAFEDVSNVSSAWRPHMLAAATLFVPASTLGESALILQARDALARG